MISEITKDFMAIHFQIDFHKYALHFDILDIVPWVH